MKQGHIRLLFVLLTGLSVFLAFNRHSHSPKYTYHSELWADRAGYYMYLPATIQHGFDAHSFPAQIDSLTGFGFKLDHSSGKVITKYTYGVALLQLPFYLAGHGIAKLIGVDDGSFGMVDHAIVNVAAPVYVLLGSYFVFMLLARRYGQRTSLIVVLGLYLGTNLFYYTVADPGMSHAYSFFLFAGMLLTLERILQEDHRIGHFILLGAMAGFILLIRPTNLVFLLAAPLLFQKTRPSAIRALLRPRHILLMAIPAILVWIPQMLYWNYIHDTPLTWPYENEGFANWNSPKLIEFMFSPNNGVLPYTPMILVATWGSKILWDQGQKWITTAAVIAFLMISYIGASWWVWHFGCGFGSRTLVEYWALFAIPVAAWFQYVQTRWGKAVPLTVFAVLAIIQLKMVYSYDGCWHTGIWDWKTYGQLIFGPTK